MKGYNMENKKIKKNQKQKQKNRAMHILNFKIN